MSHVNLLSEIGLSVLFAVVTTFLYMFGGQTMLWTRRFLLPPSQCLITWGMCYFLGLSWYLCFVPLLNIAAFDVGDKNEYEKGAVNAGVPAIGTIVLHTNWWLLLMFPAVMFSFLPNFPSLGKIGKYDILGRDLFRSAVIVAAWLIVVWFK